MKEKRLGSWMIWIAWIILIGILSLTFERFWQQRYYPNQMVNGVLTQEGIKEVHLKRNIRGHYLATGWINGQPVNFLIDTGATQIALSESLAQKLGLKKYAAAISQTANSSIRSWQTILNEVKLGNIVLHDVQAVILPDLQPSEQVLLGMNFINALELIQKKGQLILRQVPP